MKTPIAIIATLLLATSTPTLAQPAKPAPPQGLVALQVGVRDFQKSIDFYSVLGLKLGRKPHPNEWELVWEAPAHGPSIMMLMADPTKPHTVAPGSSFLIIGVPDVQAAVAKLRSVGYPVPGEPNDNGSYTVILLKDPDGTTIETIGPSKK